MSAPTELFILDGADEVLFSGVSNIRTMSGLNTTYPNARGESMRLIIGYLQDSLGKGQAVEAAGASIDSIRFGSPEATGNCCFSRAEILPIVEAYLEHLNAGDMALRCERRPLLLMAFPEIGRGHGGPKLGGGGEDGVLSRIVET